MATKSWAIGLIVFCTFITAIAQLFLKAGIKTASFDISLLYNYVLIAGLLLYLVGAVFLIIALKYGELSVLYPIFATSYIWVAILSPLFFSTDIMSPAKWAGIFLIFIGVSSVGLGGR